jgi:uncharacterized protein YodC (DUF2158 family)
LFRLASDEAVAICYCCGAPACDSYEFCWDILPMTFKSGDLVALKSGGPTMTVDTVNTDIFDDSKITGVLCAWFVGDKFERVRFDHRAIEPAGLRKNALGETETHSNEAAGDYKIVLDDMVSAMNIAADAGDGAAKLCEKSGAVAATIAVPKRVTKRKPGTRPAHKMIGPH